MKVAISSKGSARSTQHPVLPTEREGPSSWALAFQMDVYSDPLWGSRLLACLLGCSPSAVGQLLPRVVCPQWVGIDLSMGGAGLRLYVS
jgi:hypothetical protein